MSVKSTHEAKDPLRRYYNQTTIKEDVVALASKTKSSLPSYFLSYLPIIHWLPTYSKSWLGGDIIAGLTLGLLLVPQSIAYAKLAEIPVEHGLYTAFIATLVYVFFGTSREVCVGPLSVPGLLVSKIISDIATDKFTNAEIGSVVALFIGIISIILGVLRIGLILDLVPATVISGFTGGIALSIILSQINGMLGIPNVFSKFTAAEKIAAIFQNIPNLSWHDCVFGLASLTFLIIINVLANKFKASKFVTYVQLASNVILFVLATLTSFLVLKFQPEFKLSIVGSVPGGFEYVGAPSYDKDIWSKVASHLPGIFLAMVLEHMAIAKAFSKQAGYRMSYSQELFAVGICNISASLVSGFPCAGAFSRGAVLHKSGVNTPLVGLLISCILLVGFEFLTPAFYYIPIPTLAAIVSKAAFSLLPSFDKLKTFYNTHPIDLLQCLVAGVITFLFGVEWGIGSAMVCALLFVLYRLSRPKLYVLGEVVGRPNLFVDVKHPAYPTQPGDPGVFIFRVQESLIFPNVGYICEQALTYIIENAKPTTKPRPSLWSTDANGKLKQLRFKKVIETTSDKPSLKAVILDLSAVNWIDSSAIKELEGFKRQLQLYSGTQIDKPAATINEKNKFEDVESQTNQSNNQESEFQLHFVAVHPQVTATLIKSGLVHIPDLTDFECNPNITFTDENGRIPSLEQQYVDVNLNTQVDTSNITEEDGNITGRIKSMLKGYVKTSRGKKLPNVINFEPLRPDSGYGIHLSVGDALDVVRRS